MDHKGKCHNPCTHFVWRRPQRAYLMSPSSDPVATVSASTANMVSTLSGWPVPQQSLSAAALQCVHVVMSVERGMYLDTYHPSLPSGPRCRRSAHLPVCLQSPSCHPVVNQPTNQPKWFVWCVSQGGKRTFGAWTGTHNTYFDNGERKELILTLVRACLQFARSEIKYTQGAITAVYVYVHVATSS